MLFEYKIQKIVDGNGEESFEIFRSRVSEHKWWRPKQWRELDGYYDDDPFESLGKAQSALKTQMERDTKEEFDRNKHKKTVLREYTYTDIPDHIAEEQEERFCDLSEVKI